MDKIILLYLVAVILLTVYLLLLCPFLKRRALLKEKDRYVQLLSQVNSALDEVQSMIVIIREQLKTYERLNTVARDVRNDFVKQIDAAKSLINDLERIKENSYRRLDVDARDEKSC